jgi:hypothetical protein
MPTRNEVVGDKNPNFIGCWTLEKQSICDDLVDFFEKNKNAHIAGRFGGISSLDETVKKSTDIPIDPLHLEGEGFQVVSTYLEHLKFCYLDYLDQWEFLKTFLPEGVHIGPFNLRRYDESGHFGTLHSERESLTHLHRVLAWMTYLNDVEDGGETVFPMFGLKINPEKGKTLIWPSDWTHAHLGAVVRNGPKYIITGWMHLPDNHEVESA